METIHYILDNWDYLLTLTLQHLWLVALAVGLAIIIGVPLGILIVRHKWLATPVLGIATIVLTIPSIALFGLMIQRGENIVFRQCPSIRCCRLCVTPTRRSTACRRACVKRDAASA